MIPKIVVRAFAISMLRVGRITNLNCHCNDRILLLLNSLVYCYEARLNLLRACTVSHRR